MINLLLKRQ